MLVRDGKFSLCAIDSPDREFEETLPGETVLTAGPLLLLGDRTCEVSEVKFNTNRHPRTAIGIRADGTLVLVVADGRSPQAAGLSIPELQQVMVWLGCTNALNLDGGGSSTMVVSGKIVNHPSDNHAFDAEGERPVANALVVR